MEKKFPLIFYFTEGGRLCISLWNNRKQMYDTWFYCPTDHSTKSLLTKSKEETDRKFRTGEWDNLRETLPQIK